MEGKRRLVAPRGGALIVFEGIDRSGKSSQAKLLYDRLVADGVKTELLRFPDRSTPVGQLLNSVLTGASRAPAQVVHLLFSANRWETQPKIERLLEEGHVIVVDRYSFSGVAYSTTAAVMADATAKAAQGRHDEASDVNLTFEWACHTEKGLPAPDRVFFLDVKPEDTRLRGGFGNEVYESYDMQQQVYTAYQKFRSLPFWRNVAAQGLTPVELHEKILDEISGLFDELNQRGTPGLRHRLWSE